MPCRDGCARFECRGMRTLTEGMRALDESED